MRQKHVSHSRRREVNKQLRDENDSLRAIIESNKSINVTPEVCSDLALTTLEQPSLGSSLTQTSTLRQWFNTWRLLEQIEHRMVNDPDHCIPSLDVLTFSSSLVCHPRTCQVHMHVNSTPSTSTHPMN